MSQRALTGYGRGIPSPATARPEAAGHRSMSRQGFPPPEAASR